MLALCAAAAGARRRDASHDAAARRSLRHFDLSKYNNSCYLGGEVPHLLKLEGPSAHVAQGKNRLIRVAGQEALAARVVAGVSVAAFERRGLGAAASTRATPDLSEFGPTTAPHRESSPARDTAAIDARQDAYRYFHARNLARHYDHYLRDVSTAVSNLEPAGAANYT
mmetsp:Transcript_2921/g.8564  ORF Transcript_2921/g.8564 Transcript_2921/m.8564 type:complete len:168 (-) Transcript_2921:2128-2631(-)